MIGSESRGSVKIGTGRVRHDSYMRHSIQMERFDRKDIDTLDRWQIFNLYYKPLLLV